jgi:outer membrane protein
MKKLLLIMLFGLSFNLFAQPVAKSLFVGGSLGFSSVSTEQGPGNPDEKESIITIAPNVGYFLSDKMAIGLNFGFSSGKVDDGVTVDKASALAFGPYFQYYKTIGESPFALVGEAGIQFAITKDKPAGAPTVTGNFFGFYVAPGVTYFFAKKWALDFKLRAIQLTINDPNTDGASTGDKDTTFQFGLESLNPSLGFRYFFNKN